MFWRVWIKYTYTHITMDGVFTSIKCVFYFFLIKIGDLKKDKIYIYIKNSVLARGNREAISFLALWQ